MARNRADRSSTHVSDRVRASYWARRVRLEIAGDARKVGGSWSVRRALLVLHRPLLFGGFDLTKIGDAGARLGGSSRLDEVRDCDRHQDADDENHDHDLDEGETALIGLT